MDKVIFTALVEKAFSRLPAMFRERVDNVQLFVEDVPSPEQVRSMQLSSRNELLGLYEGVPLEHRGTWYGATPTVPDRITLFQKNIERMCRSDDEVERKIQEVLIHEIAHYFGMNDEEIRAAGY